MGDRWMYAWGLGSISLGGASLIIPLYVVELGESAFTIGILASVAAFVGIPGALVVGPYAERSGRHRDVIIGALGLIAVVLLVVPMIEAIPVLVVANALIWFAFAAILPVLTLLAVADVPERAWSERIARLNAFQGIGWALGLVVGAVLSFGLIRVMAPITVHRILLLVYAAIAVSGAVGGARWFPREDLALDARATRRLRRAIMRASRFNVRGTTFPLTPSRVEVRGLHPRRFITRFTPPLALYFLAMFLFFAGFAAFFAPLPAFLSEADFSSDEIFLLYVVSSLAAAIAFGAAGRLATRYGSIQTQTVGLTIRAIAIPAVAIAIMALGSGGLGLTIGAVIFIVIGLSWALIIVTAGALVTQLSPSTIRGESLGVYSAVMAFAGGVGAILGGRLALIGYLVAFGAAGGLVGLSTLLVLASARISDTHLYAGAGTAEVT